MIDQLRPAQDRELLRWEEQLDAACDAGTALDEFGTFEREDHLMNRRWRDDEEALHVSFGGRSSHDAGIGIDEGQILALSGGEAGGAVRNSVFEPVALISH